jgi:transposase
MAVSLHKKIVRGHAYWYARECQRVGGKPKIVWQKYLGKAEDISTRLGSPTVPPKPRETVLFDFAAPAALYDLMQQLDIVSIVDRYAGKRGQGVGVGTYIALAALNRCLAPKSKAGMLSWYQSTVLRRLLPIPARHLTSQRFWDHMCYLDEEKIRKIEEEITRILIDRFQIKLDCLLYDTTNFYTFIDSFNEAASLAQRGKSKEKRTDLRIVGLALLVTQDFHIPLLHQVYPGNVHDSTTFSSFTDALVARYKLFAENVDAITLVFDKGNNSKDNQPKIDASPYHFVGSLSPAQHADLIGIPLSRFKSLSGDLEDVLSYRTQKVVFGVERTILVTHNPELFRTQSATILREMKKCTSKLKELQARLSASYGTSKPIIWDSARTQISAILHGRHMKDLINTELSVVDSGGLRLNYRVDQSAWRHLQATLLGKNILFTDQDGWSDEQIVRAYRGQYHIEEAFKRMKHPHFVSWRPMFHWTDQKIRVHAFYCVLALLLSSLLRRSLAQHNLEISIPKLLETLSKIKEVALFYRTAESKSKPVISYTHCNALQSNLIKALNLEQYKLS